MYNDRLQIMKEFYLTTMFYGFFGVKMKAKRINKETSKMYLEYTVPDDTDIILNGKKSFYGEELAKAFTEMMNYYYAKIQEGFQDPYDVKTVCSLRKEIHTLTIFKDNIERITSYPNDGILNVTNDVKKELTKAINNSIEYIGTNGINVNLNELISELVKFLK